MPQCQIHYQNATNDVFGVSVRFSPKDSAKFRKLEQSLRKKDILSMDYAYRLLHHLKSWVYNKGWKCLPVGVFIGEWAQNLYLKDIGNRKFEYIKLTDEERGLLVAEEIQILMYAIQYGLSYDDAVDAMEPLLTEQWHESRSYRSHMKIHKEAQMLVGGVI